MLLTKEIEIKINPNNIKHYKSLGYNVKPLDVIVVKTEELPTGSHSIVDVLCDYCKNNVLKLPYRQYLKTLKTNGKTCCKNCKGAKIKESTLKKYGVENISQLDNVKQKKKETTLMHYGVESPLQSKEILDKLQSTCLAKYGAPCSFMNEEVRENYKKTLSEKYGVDNVWEIEEVKKKVNETIKFKYGVDNVSCNEEIKEKKRQASLKKYGTEYVLQSNEVREKIANTMCNNNSQKASKQQKYLNALYDGILNYPISNLSADIFLEEYGIDIEYDGGGHNLSVKFGNVTQEEFDHKEMIRRYIVKKEGHKQIRIISSKDKLPSDEILLQMLEQAKEYFSTTSHTWIEYNIDTSSVRNAEHKDGVFFNYGELRKIKRIA